MSASKFLAIVLAYGVLCGSARTADPIIQGYVSQIDKKTPIDNVNIEIYSTPQNSPSILINSTTTDMKGYYKFDKISAKESYDILYSHGKQESDIVTCLAETGQQQIRKYLYQKGQKPKSVNDLQQRIFTIKRLTMLALTTEKPGSALTEFTKEISYLDPDKFSKTDREIDLELDEFVGNKILTEKNSLAVKNLIKIEYQSLRLCLKSLPK